MYFKILTITILMAFFIPAHGNNKSANTVLVAAIGPWAPPFGGFLQFANYVCWMINQRTDILPNVTINLQKYDTGFTSPGQAEIQSVMAANQGAIAFLSGARTSQQTQVAYASTFLNIPQVGGIVSGAIFSSKPSFPMFMRTAFSDQSMAVAMAKFVNEMGWKNVALISENDSFGTGNQAVFNSYAAEYNISVTQIVVNLGGTNFSAQVNQLKAAQNRIIVLMTEYAEGLIFLQNANASGLIGPDYVWLIDQVFFLSFENAFLPNASVRALLDGAIPFRASINGGTNQSETLQQWQEANATLWPGNHVSVDDTAWMLAEGLWTIAFGLDQVLRENDGNLTAIGPQLYTAMRGLDYQGISGRVAFDSNGDRLGDYNVWNYGRGGVVANISHTYSPFDDIFTVYNEIVFYGGRIDVPRDMPCFCVHGTCIGYSQICICDSEEWGGPECSVKNSFVPFNAPLSGALGAIIGIATMIVLFAGFLLVRYTDAFNGKSPLFCAIILVGVLLEFLSAFSLLPERTDSLCMVFPWFVGLGFTLVFGCLFLKSWRIYRLIDSAVNCQKLTISNVYIIKLLSIGLTVEIILLIVWTAYDPLKAVIAPFADGSTRYVCSSGTEAIFWPIFGGYKLLWMIFGAVIAFKTRGIYSKFNESKIIAFSIYNTFVMLIIAVPLAIILRSYPYVLLCVEVALILIVFLFIVITMFFETCVKIFVGEPEVLPELRPQPITVSASSSFNSSEEARRKRTMSTAVRPSPSTLSVSNRRPDPLRDSRDSVDSRTEDVRIQVTSSSVSIPAAYSVSDFRRFTPVDQLSPADESCLSISPPNNDV